MKKLLLILILAFPVCTLALWVCYGIREKQLAPVNAGPSGTNSIRIETISSNAPGN